jgi:hypothetical protein
MCCRGPDRAWIVAFHGNYRRQLIHKCSHDKFSIFGWKLIDFDSDSERFKRSQNTSFKPR